MVSRVSRAPGVTIGTPPTGSAPTHVGSPPPRDYHHCFVAGCVWVGGGWVEGVAGGPRGGEPSVPDVWSHVQDSPDKIRTHTPRLTTPETITTVSWLGVGGWVGGGCLGGGGYRGSPRW